METEPRLMVSSDRPEKPGVDNVNRRTHGQTLALLRPIRSLLVLISKNVQVGNDQEKAQSERGSH